MIKKRLIELLGDSKKYIYLSVLFKWMALISQIAIVYASVNLIKLVFEGSFETALVLKQLGVFMLALVLRVASEKLIIKSSYMSSRDVKKILRNKIFDKLERIGSNYSESVSTAEVVQMTTEGVEQLEIYFGQYLPQFFYSMIAPITLFAVISFISVKVATVLLLCVPLIPVSIVMVQKFAKKLLSRYWNTYTSLGDSFLENLQGLTTLKIYKADEYKAKEMDEEAAKFRRITMKVLVMQLNSISVMDIVALGGAAIGMVFAIRGVMAGSISIFGAFFIILLSAEFFIPMRMLGSFFHIAMNGMAASDKIFALLDLPETKDGTQSIDASDLTMKIENLNFSYDESRQILKNINMIFDKNFVAIVGKSGCGKSTIAKILCAKLKNYSGELKIGAVDFRNVKKSSLMKNLTSVTHNAYIFKGTIRDNLKMAGHVSDADMLKAIDIVNLTSLIDERDGLDTEILEGGSNLSGGEKQRLALARAILKNSPIYIFDEATSNVDAESEDIIMNAIKELAKSKKVIMISHKLSNIVDADRIYFMEDGKILNSGTHDELIENCAQYKEMYNHQQSLENYGRDDNE